MKRILNSIAILAMLALILPACSDDDSNPIGTSDPDVERPANLRAYSDDGSIGLTWTPSTSETETNFAGYTIKVYDRAADDTSTHTTSKGNGYEVLGLTNGKYYDIFVYGRTTAGKLSPSYAKITWSPAVRHTVDKNGQVIRVYSTRSSFDSGIDIHNDQGQAEVISQSGQDFVDRGDLYVFADANNADVLEIRTADNAQNAGPKVRFSNVSAVLINNLSEYAASSTPLVGTYDKNTISIGTAAIETGKMYYGRLEHGPNENEYYYFRMLVKRGNNGALVQGVGADQYVELEFSFQSVQDVPFSKK